MRKIIVPVFVFLITCTFLINTTYAKWAYAFVVYDGNVYVVSETHIEPNTIGKKIGEVTNYSNQEGTYSGNFSNQFSKGTEYYEIQGVKIKEAIAIKESEKLFIKAEYNGKYSGSPEYVRIVKNLFMYFIGFVLLIGFIYLVLKKRNSRQ